MLEIRGRNAPLCDGMPRRSFLKLGSLGIVGLSLPELLTIRQAQAASERRDTAVILFWMAGGPSHIDTYDLKPNATDQIRGPFKPIKTNQPGLDVCELLPRHTKIADKLTIVRSLHHSLNVHDDASHWVQTGFPLLNARQRGQSNPSQGSVVSYLRGTKQQDLPPYVCIPEAYSSAKGFYQTASFLGARYNPLAGGGDPSLGKYRLPEFVLPADMTLPRLEHRRELLKTLNGMVQNVERSGVLADLDPVQQQAFELVAGPRAREAFDVSREPAALREKYGKHAWGQSALLARRLVEVGASFVTINLYEADVDWWDDHTTIETGLKRRLPKYDQALSTLIEDLHDRGLAERVLVVACGEFGRAPRVDDKGGRGHWPRAMSALLSGGGIKGGQVIGSTVADGSEPKDRPLGPGDLLASIYRVLGINHEQFLRDQQNRPIRLVEAGEPIKELFS
jgi:hypothetical protein